MFLRLFKDNWLFILVLIVVAFLAYRLYQKGYSDGATAVTAEQRQQELRRSETANRDLLRLINRTDRLVEQLATQDQRHTQEQTHAQAEIHRLHDAVRTGALRLSIPTVARICASAPGPGDTAAASNAAAPRAELDPAAAEALVTITADGDDAIRDLNACIERYDTVRLAVQQAAANAPLE